MNYYFAIKWGDHIRIEQAPDSRRAARLAYGAIADDMKVRNLGTRSPAYWSNKKRIEMLGDTLPWEHPFKRTIV